MPDRPSVGAWGGARMVMKLCIWMEMWEILFAALEYLWVRNELKRMGMVKLKGKRNACRPSGRSGSDACRVMMLKDLGPSWWFDYVFAFWGCKQPCERSQLIHYFLLSPCAGSNRHSVAAALRCQRHATAVWWPESPFHHEKITTQITLSLKQLFFQSLENVDWSFRVWPWLSRKNDLCDLSHDHIVPWTSHRTDHLRPYNSLLDMGRAPVKSTRALLGQRHTVLLPPSNFLEIEQASEGWWFFERSCWRFPAVFLGGSVDRMDHYHFILKLILLLL